MAASEACLNIPQLLPNSSKVTFVANPVLKLNTLYAIFNNKGLGNFRVRPKHSVLKEMDAN